MGRRQRSSTHTRLDFCPNILWDHCKLVERTFSLQRMWRVLECHWTAVWSLTNMSVLFAVLLLCTSETLGRFVIFWLNLSLKSWYMPSSLLACMDYCNSILYGLPKRLIQRLQHIQNTAARLVTRSNRDDHVTPVLKSLHWLPVHLQGTAAHVQNNPWQRAIIFIRVSFKLHSKQKPSLIIKKPSLSAQD